MAVSLLVASVFWYSIVIGEAEIREKVVALPIEYIGTPKDMILVGDKPLEVKAHLVGPKSSLVSSSDFRVRIDLSKSGAGKKWFAITSDNINLVKKVKLVDIKPSGLSLELMHLVEKDIVIKPQFTGALPSTLRLISVDVWPDRIKGLVASNLVGKKDLVISTTPVDLDSIKANTTVTGKIIAPPTIQSPDKKWLDVEIQIKVEQKRPRTGG
jgi:YbbR domain-containing protein